MTEKDSISRLLDSGLSTKRVRLANPPCITLKCDGERTVRLVAKYMTPCFQEKASSTIYMVPVPRTNTRGQGENPKASEITVAKELCKITP